MIEAPNPLGLGGTGYDWIDRNGDRTSSRERKATSSSPSAATQSRPSTPT